MEFAAMRLEATCRTVGKRSAIFNDANCLFQDKLQDCHQGLWDFMNNVSDLKYSFCLVNRFWPIMLYAKTLCLTATLVREKQPLAIQDHLQSGKLIEFATVFCRPCRLAKSFSEMTWKRYDHSMPRFKDGECSYSIPSPVTENMPFEDEVDCEQPGHGILEIKFLVDWRQGRLPAMNSKGSLNNHNINLYHTEAFLVN